MRIADYLGQSFSNLRKRKLRTFLTTFGVVIGIGALVSMISFGKGIQRNVTKQFKEMDLFSYVMVFPGSGGISQILSSAGVETKAQKEPSVPMDDRLIEKIKGINGVVLAFPEIRFPARIHFNNKQKFSLIQVLPAKIGRSNLVKLRAGIPYSRDDENALIISDSFLRDLGVKEPKSALGRKIKLSTLAFDLSRLTSANAASMLQGKELPFSTEIYTLTLIGVAERMSFGGPMPLKSNVFIPPITSSKMKKLTLTSIWDFFQRSKGAEGYSLINVKVSSPPYVAAVKKFAADRGLSTFALMDQFDEIKKGFFFMNMFLAAVGMIAIVVSALGIINTMVMSTVERYREIGIMKAVGASNGDVRKIFLFESGVIGFLGGTFGLVLGWTVSQLINIIINVILSRQGMPFIDYFDFPWWLCLGALLFSIFISLVSGTYPTLKAVRVDPVKALRHD